MAVPFRDRTDAGQFLSTKLMAYANREDVLVLALPRGGVPVAFEVAKAINAPLDVFLVRKLGVPGNKELAMGAIATGDVLVLNEEVIKALDVPRVEIDLVTAKEKQELERRERIYRGDYPPPDVQGYTVILIDDGLATGSTMRAAVVALRKQTPGRIVIAVPIAAESTCNEFRSEVDEVICAVTPQPFLSVGTWYENFLQITDDDVREILKRARHELPDVPRRGMAPRLGEGGCKDDGYGHTDG